MTLPSPMPSRQTWAQWAFQFIRVIQPRLAQIEATSVRQEQVYRMRIATVGTLPSAAPAGQWIYVSDETGGAIPCFSDGTNWRRVTDRAIAS